MILQHDAPRARPVCRERCDTLPSVQCAARVQKKKHLCAGLGAAVRYCCAGAECCAAGCPRRKAYDARNKRACCAPDRGATAALWHAPYGQGHTRTLSTLHTIFRLCRTSEAPPHARCTVLVLEVGQHSTAQDAHNQPLTRTRTHTKHLCNPNTRSHHLSFPRSHEHSSTAQPLALVSCPLYLSRATLTF